jgi:glc operon protein GlcG
MLDRCQDNCNLVFLAVAGIFALAMAQAAGAQTPATGLNAGSAEAIIAGCRQHAAAKGQSHSVAIVDAGGSPVATLRMDGNPPGTIDFAIAKAEAVAAWRFSTADMARAAEGTPGFARAPHVVTVAGGVPVFSADGRTFLGAAGASGEAPADDAACVEAGIRSAGLSFQRK